MEKYPKKNKFFRLYLLRWEEFGTFAIRIMTRDEIKGAYCEAKSLAICQEARNKGDFTDFVRQYMYDEEDFVSRNVLSGMTKASTKELQQLRPMLDELIDLSMNTGSQSVRRVTLSLLERIGIKEDNLRTDFLDFCMEHMIIPQEPPAIQSLCMKLSYRMCSFHQELMNELLRITEEMDMNYYTQAIKTVRKKLLQGKGLKRTKK